MTTAPTLLYIARHGQSETNSERRITGQLDPGLSPAGREQAAMLARCLAGVAGDPPIAAVYSSTLQRTVATAQPAAAALGLAPVALDALREIHSGVLQGRHRDERDPEAQALWTAWKSGPPSGRLPGGESFDDLVARVAPVLAMVLERHCGQGVLMVGHRGTNRVLLGQLLGLPRAEWTEINQSNKAVVRVRLGALPEVATLRLEGNRAGEWRPGLRL